MPLYNENLYGQRGATQPAAAPTPMPNTVPNTAPPQPPGTDKYIQPTGDWRDYYGPGSGWVSDKGGPGQNAYDQVFRLLAKLEAAGTAALNPNFSVTPQDQALSQQVFDSTLNMANSALQQGAGDLSRAISGNFAQRGLSGSTMEAAQAGIAQRGLQDRLYQMLNQTRGEQAQFLGQQPYERARANAALFNSLTQAAIPALNWRQSQLMVGVPNGGKKTAADYVGPAIQGAAAVAPFLL